MKNVDLKLAGFCGIIAPLTTIVLILIAISYSPWFSWTENALSDLGVGSVALLFNLGLIFCGVLSFIFALGLRKFLRVQKLCSLGALIFGAATIALCGIRIFPENVKNIHLYFSIAFFVLLSLSLLVLRESMIIGRRSRKLGVVVLILGILSLAIWLWPSNGVAIHEFVASSAGTCSSVILGIKLIAL